MNYMKPLHSKAAQLELNQVLQEEHPIQFIKMDSPIPVEELLDFMLKLHASLDLEQIFKTVAKTINQHTVIDHLGYSNADLDLSVNIGSKQANTFSYNIIDEREKHIGELVISRKTPFDENDTNLFECLICYAIFAIRNNIDYQYAMMNSLTDPLTELGNRRALNKTINHERELAKRFNQPFSVIAIDIDNFKSINDTYGHDVGDMMLQHVSKELALATREYDELFRLGGDEFIVVLNQADAETALNVAYRIVKSIRRKQFDIKNDTLTTTVSIGVAISSADDDNQSILDRADQALYRAKHQGKDCIRT
jgi:diguanylate cyclase (GGDEF)-like protein